MNAEEFIAGVRQAVFKSAVVACFSAYEDPPGRAPEPSALELSRWFKNLSDEDRQMVEGLANDVASATVFGFLCVLDGVRTLEPEGPKGEFQLWFQKGKSGFASMIPRTSFYMTCGMRSNWRLEQTPVASRLGAAQSPFRFTHRRKFNG
jgi:hypothetical protein